MTFPTAPPLFQLGHVDRLAPGPADAAMDGVLHDEGPQPLMPGATQDVEDEGMAPRVLPAGAAATEPACRECRALTGPTVHLRSPNGPAKASPDIMARPAAEFTHRFA